MEWISSSPDETRRLGRKLAEDLKPQDVIALTGEIGSGKTTFVQGIAEGLGVPSGRVASPSFVLIREYHGGRIPLYHADLYRLNALPEAQTLGLEEYFEQGGVTVIEWADRLPDLLPLEHLEIRFEVVDPERRSLRVMPLGSRYEGRAHEAPGD
ncbi:MAG: tRNA (adenosine(37)-N6)-threonylcarbamoyltransferase complex ATPase subunit type 1 TsaE [Candidatus Omnitrophica bacterium]|nr:tRNA (adenosine(37)-N6)-threonylcarbamoyltransferase complex ATPase subunit type 1 TsaE [Candidatus Omnitrophota bacterium]